MNATVTKLNVIKKSSKPGTSRGFPSEIADIRDFIASFDEGE
jgi:hypothetical protein